MSQPAQDDLGNVVHVARNDPAPGGLGPTHGPALRDLTEEPAVRIRIARGEASVVVGGDAKVLIHAPGRGAAPIGLRGPVTFARKDQVWRIVDASRQVREFRGEQLDVGPGPDGLTKVGDRQYPGRIALREANGDDGLDVVNTVGMESYLPGVLQRELFPSWDPAAFRAQAIAARSYALWELRRSRLRGRPYDLESTTASQAYVGVASNPKASDAVRATRGQVLAFEGHVVPAFYSSSHGGLGADGHLVFPGRSPDIAPLHGFNQGDVDKASNRHRWQASRSADDLARRLRAWGQANRNPMARLRGPIRGVSVAQTNAAGRHLAYYVDDAAGVRFLIPADRLRHAANFTLNPANPRDNTIGSPGDLAKLSADNTLYSGHFTPVVRDGTVFFTEGHGYGHGVGMSQFGAQGMAQAGRSHEQIVRYFYPGAEVRKLYP